MDISFDTNLISNKQFKIYKKQIINIGFTHRESKYILKHLIKNFPQLLIYDNILFIDLMYVHYYHYYNPYSDYKCNPLIKKIIHKWIINNHGLCNYKCNYCKLNSLLLDFGSFMEWSNIFLEIPQIYITEMLIYHYHKIDKKPEYNYIYLKPISSEDNYYIFFSDKHKMHFYNKVNNYNMNLRNFNIFSQNFSNLLCTELLEHICDFVIC